MSQTLKHYTTNVMSRWDLTPQTWCWGDWQLLPNPDSMQLWEVSPSGTSSNTRTGSVAHNVQVQMLVQYPCFQGVGPEQIEKLQEAAGTILNKLWNYDSAQHGIHHNLTIWSQKDLCLHCICWPIIGWIIETAIQNSGHFEVAPSCSFANLRMHPGSNIHCQC